ncbi:hypothetical protein FRB94_004627 [Tulasnella sp. JGI-2019a]|nr:hypothetical protein FRB93_003960 [Tulasnella sp. JGI-2019a]KAG9001641.1 hypothetical protein FRB94_004627 [Tulasnella sp. JGI-2019a]
MLSPLSSPLDGLRAASPQFPLKPTLNVVNLPPATITITMTTIITATTGNLASTATQDTAHTVGKVAPAVRAEKVVANEPRSRDA